MVTGQGSAAEQAWLTRNVRRFAEFLIQSSNFKVQASLLVLCLCTGCAGKSWFHARGPEFATAGPENPVVQILSLWQSAEGQGLDGRKTRGFGGQIYFITRNQQVPALAQGDIRIAVFEDDGPREAQVKPIHQFDFSADAWQTHLNPTQLGPCYQVFIPYTKAHDFQIRCSLSVRFVPKVGQAICSELVSVLLPGTRPPEAEPTTPQPRVELPPVPQAASNRPTSRIRTADAAREAELDDQSVEALNGGVTQAGWGVDHSGRSNPLRAPLRGEGLIDPPSSRDGGTSPHPLSAGEPESRSLLTAPKPRSRHPLAGREAAEPRVGPNGPISTGGSHLLAPPRESDSSEESIVDESRPVALNSRRTIAPDPPERMKTYTIELPNQVLGH